MKDGMIQIYHGLGHGKSNAAVGAAVAAAVEGKEAILIQFLKGRNEADKDFISRLEPEIKCFNFSKQDVGFDELDEEGRNEELMNLRNGFGYAKKVISTGSVDLVILDEILGLVEERIVTVDEIKEMLLAKPDEMRIICTGRVLDDGLREVADEIYKVVAEKSEVC